MLKILVILELNLTVGPCGLMGLRHTVPPSNLLKSAKFVFSFFNFHKFHI